MPDRQPRTLLEQLVREREQTYEEQVNAFERLARELKEPATMTVRHLQRLAAGQRAGERANPSTRRVMRQLYGHPLDELLGPPRTSTFRAEVVATAPDPRQLTAAAARGSLEFACWADANHVAPAFVEHASYELARIAVDYVSTPPLPLVQDLIALRDITFELIRERPNPRQARELFRLAGTTCLLMAHASQNLGDSSSAMAQARTAWACAEQADHNGLRGWVRGTQALIAEWSRRPADAVAFAQEGQKYAVTADSLARLAALEARSYARLADEASARLSLQKAEQARELDAPDDDVSALGGLLTFPLAKQLYYAGSTHGLVGNHLRSERMAAQAIELYENGPPEQRSYGDEALARVDVANARLVAGDVAGADAVLEPVLAMPPAQRIRQVHDGLSRVRAALVVPRYARAVEAGALIDKIDGFSSPSMSRLPVISPR